MRFDLHSPSLARYHWGTLFCGFSPAAPVKKETFYQFLASSLAGTASWTTDEEFRAAVAMRHEIVHLAQDLTTGLGHADFLTNKTSTTNLLFYAAAVVRTDGPAARPPYRQPGSPPWLKEDAVVREAHDQLRYCPFAMIPQARLERIRAILQEELKRSIDDESLFDFSTQSILECDAALNLICNVRELRMTDAQHSILKRNTGVLDREALGPEYWKATSHLEAVLDHYAAPDDRQLELILPATFGLLVDSALAFPPVDWIEARGERADDYEPGVKYVRLLLALQKLVGATGKQFWSAFSAKRYAEAELILLANASFHYPTSEEIYRTWIQTLEPLVSKSVTAAIRHAACRYRLQHGILRIQRDITFLVDMEAPFLYFHKDHGFVKHDWGQRMFDRDADIGLTGELLNQFMIVELADFLFRTGEFRCPHAQADTCSAVEDRCMSGFVHLAQFPSSSGCLARSVLEKCGVNLPAG